MEVILLTIDNSFTLCLHLVEKRLPLSSLMESLKHISIPGNKPLLIFGGIYSNLHALIALREWSQEHGYEPHQIICTGDITAYCAYPEESIRLVQEWGIHCIKGNVEQNIVDGNDDCGCNFESGTRCDLLSKQWYPYTQSRLSDESRDFLAGLPLYLRFDYGELACLVLHGGYPDISQFIFASTDAQTKLDILEATSSDLILAGHCGLPFGQVLGDNQYWFNAGVIGMPANDGLQSTWFMTLRSQPNGKPNAQYHKLHYPARLARQAMDDQGLLPSYAETLETGIWDNCDILPQTESLAQGKMLSLSSVVG